MSNVPILKKCVSKYTSLSSWLKYPTVIKARKLFIVDYVQTGFIWLQYEVDRALIAAKSGSANLFSEIQVQLKKMPYPPYLQDPLLTAIQQNLPLFLMLGFILYVIQTAKNLVYEKERK